MGTVRSSSRPAGTRSSRSGNSASASSAPTTLGTPATSPPSPSLPMDLSALPAARTGLPCSGISTRASTFTLSRPATSSTPSSSLPTVTGSARRRPLASRSLTSRASRSSMSSSPISPPLPPTPASLSACPSLGPQTVRPSLQATPTTSSVSTTSCKWVYGRERSRRRGAREPGRQRAASLVPLDRTPSVSDSPEAHSTHTSSRSRSFAFRATPCRCTQSKVDCVQCKKKKPDQSVTQKKKKKKKKKPTQGSPQKKKKKKKKK